MQLWPSIPQHCTDQAEIATSTKSNPQQQASWRHRLHCYLDRLFTADPTAAAEFHGVQVALYADFAPEQLLSFLQTSQGYSLDKALHVCAARGFVREQVYILERMGNAKAALELLIGRLRDLTGAIELVARQGDAALWDVLIDLTLQNSQLTGTLWICGVIRRNNGSKEWVEIMGRNKKRGLI